MGRPGRETLSSRQASLGGKSSRGRWPFKKGVLCQDIFFKFPNYLLGIASDREDKFCHVSLVVVLISSIVCLICMKLS